MFYVGIQNKFDTLPQVQGGIRLPLAGIASPRLLMCSASMGAEGSVTLQLREAVEAPDSSGQSDTTALTIGYPETDLLADIQGSIQATGNLLTKYIYHVTIVRSLLTHQRHSVLARKSFHQY